MIHKCVRKASASPAPISKSAGKVHQIEILVKGCVISSPDEYDEDTNRQLVKNLEDAGYKTKMYKDAKTHGWRIEVTEVPAK